MPEYSRDWCVIQAGRESAPPFLRRSPGSSESVEPSRFPPSVRMAHRLVAITLTIAGLPDLNAALKRRDDLLRLLHELAMASHLGKRLVVADILQHVEWSVRSLSSGIDSKLGPHELLLYSTQTMAGCSAPPSPYRSRRFRVRRRPSPGRSARRRASLHTDSHPEPVATGASGPASITCRGSGTVKPCDIQPDSVKLSITTVAFLSSTGHQIFVRRAGWTGRLALNFFGILSHLLLEVGAHLAQFLDQVELRFLVKSRLQLLDRLIICRNTSLGSPTSESPRHLPSDTRGRRIDLDILRLVIPCRRAAENARRSRSGSRASARRRRVL